MRLFKKILTWTLIIFIFLIAQGLFLIHLYEDDIKEVAVERINKQLNTQISVGQISFSVFEHFPFASIRFPDVQMKEAIPGTNRNLLSANELSLLFSVWDLYNKNYTIKKLYLKDASVLLTIDSSGKVNYNFWKEGTGETDNSFKLNLEEIILNNVDVIYQDQQLQQLFSWKFERAKVSGKFYEQQFDLHLKGNLFVNKVFANNTTYLLGKKINTDALLHINLKDGVYTFNKVILNLEEIRLLANGSITVHKDQREVDLDINGDKVTIQSFISLLPEQYARYFKDYKSRGDFYFNTKIKGSFTNGLFPGVSVYAGINNGIIEIKNDRLGNRKFENVNLKFSYTNGTKRSDESSEIKITQFDAVLNKRPVHARFSLKNFNDPYIDLFIDASASLIDLQAILRTDKIDISSGELFIKAGFEGLTRNFKNASNIHRIKSEGDLLLSNASFKVRKSGLNFKDFNGSFLFRNNDLKIVDFGGFASESDFKLNGYFRNLIGFILLPDQDLEIDAQLASRKINLDELLSVSVSSTNDTVYALKINPKLICRLKADIDQLSFERFKAENIQGSFFIENSTLSSDYLGFNALGGLVYSKIKIDARNTADIKFYTDANLQGVDLKRLFYEFKNFGLDILRDEHLKGTLTASMQVETHWTANLKAKLPLLKAQGNVLVENGELINFQPMLALSRFIDVKELQHLRFSTIENKIEIKDQTVYIPGMDIQSNALNITLSGTHQFSNIIDYRIRMLLSDLLYRNSKRLGDERFGEIEDDGYGKTTLFLRMYGDASDPKFSLDKENIKKKISEDLKQEKQEIKSILKEEFNSWFKKDAGYKEQISEESQAWERDIPGSSPKASSPKAPSKALSDTTKKQSIFNKLKEKLNEPVEEEIP